MKRDKIFISFTVYILGLFFILILSCVETLYMDEEKDKPFTVTVPTNGLAAYYPFNGNADDLSGNGLNGNIMSGASMTSDRNGIANRALYTGSGWVSVPHNNLLNLQDFTISAWIRMEEIPSAFNCFIGKDYDTGYSMGIISGSSPDCANTTVTRSLRISVGDSLFFSNFLCNTWYHMAVTYEYSTGIVQVFVNGVNSGSSTTASPITDNTYPLGIGRDGYNGDQFTGTIDEVCIYNRVLTSAEINTIYNN